MLTIAAFPSTQRRFALVILALGAGLAGPPAAAQEHTVIFEDPGRIIAVEGSHCGTGRSAAVRLNGSFLLPAYATRATVFLNGWHMRYGSGDHEVRTIGSSVLNIRTSVSEAGRVLSWLMQGQLHDKNSDDGYDFCGHYTLIGWHPRWIDAVVDDRNANSAVAFDHDSLDPPEIRNPAFADRARAAILPRGFDLTWMDGATFTGGTLGVGNCFSCPMDFNVLQVGYALRQPSGFGREAVRWSGNGIIKDDNAEEGSFMFEAWVSALVGDDVSVRRGSLSLVPREDTPPVPPCVAPGDGAVVTEQFQVDRLRFDYALPLLTGVELYYPCDDEEVKEIAAWIHDIEYRQPTSGAADGVLSYRLSTVLQDKDNDPAHLFEHKVDVLGLFAGGPHGGDVLAPQ
jgi:hypothetical protein